MSRASAHLALALVLAGCAAVDPGDPSAFDFAVVDLVGGPSDLTTPSDLACGLGTPDHCGSCATSCPGVDDATTTRTCSAPTALGACSILCKAESYDVDGNAQNGCELDDPAHATAATAVAVTLPNVAVSSGTCNNGNNGCTVSRAIGSDLRKHDVAPVDRPDGREDWFVINVVGAGGPSTTKACLSIGNATWPTDNQYEVCISANGTMTPTICATAIARGASMCVQPSGNPDAGTYYIKVRKKQGTPTSLGYALYLEH